MSRCKSESLSPPPRAFTSEPCLDGIPYLPTRPDRKWTRNRKSQIAQLRLIHEKDANDSFIRKTMIKKDEKEALKKLKKPFKLQNLIKKDDQQQSDPINRMGMTAPSNNNIPRGPQKSTFRKYNCHISPTVETGSFPNRFAEEIDWILDRHDTRYKPNCYDTLPPYATALAGKSCNDDPSSCTRPERKRKQAVPLPRPGSYKARKIEQTSRQAAGIIQAFTDDDPAPNSKKLFLDDSNDEEDDHHHHVLSWISSSISS